MLFTLYMYVYCVYVLCIYKYTHIYSIFWKYLRLYIYIFILLYVTTLSTVKPQHKLESTIKDSLYIYLQNHKWKHNKQTQS